MDDIITQLGLESLSQEEQNEILSQFTDSLLKRLVVRVYDRLNDQDQATFDQVTESGDQAQVESFLKTKIPNLEEIREEETSGLIQEMKDFLSPNR